MNANVTKIIYLISKVYWGFFYLLMPVVLLFSFSYIFLVIGPQHSTVVFNLTSAFTSKAENKEFLDIISLPYVQLGLFALILILFFNAKIFKNIASLFSNQHNLLFHDKKNRVYKTIKYILITFALSIVSELCLYQFPSSANSTSLVWTIISYVLPGFGSPIDLVFCFVLYFYIKDQEEIENLKKESELVI